jgi:type IV pilus assembly protein PilA
MKKFILNTMFLKRKASFTLVEIMVVVGVIVILMTLAIPSMLRSRINTNEAAAVASCRTVADACQSYYANVIPHTYPSGFEELVTLEPPYIDNIFNAVAPERQGYIFTYTIPNSESFIVRAEPISPGRSGVRYFYVDETGLITNRIGGAAGPNDPPVSG